MYLVGKHIWNYFLATELVKEERHTCVWNRWTELISNWWPPSTLYMVREHPSFHIVLSLTCACAHMCATYFTLCKVHQASRVATYMYSCKVHSNSKPTAFLWGKILTYSHTMHLTDVINYSSIWLSHK